MIRIQNRGSASELVWAYCLDRQDDFECWHFGSNVRDVAFWLPPCAMRGADPDGQLLLVEFGQPDSPHPIHDLVIIPGVGDRSIIDRHVAWIPSGKEYILRDIWGMLGYLRDPALRTFYHSVLTDDALMEIFYKAQASHHHHHDYVGGLVDHSHEVATTAASLCLQHKIGALSASVAFVGGLFHDIGKTYLYYNQHGESGCCGQHEAFNFMVMARPLDKLRMSSPKIFEALSSCLAIKVGRHPDAYLPANMVHLCDRLSVDVCNWRRAFADAPSFYWYAKSPVDAHLYKRLS